MVTIQNVSRTMNAIKTEHLKKNLKKPIFEKKLTKNKQIVLTLTI